MTTAGLRTEQLPDIPNFRDAALTAPSGPMRAGVVYRSSRLSGRHEGAGAALVALGVTDVFDLRTTAEVEHRPDRLPHGVRLTMANVLADRPHGGAVTVGTLARSGRDPAVIASINESVGGGRARELMLQTYRDFVELPSALRGFGEVLRGIARAEGASIVHCTAGKDRSGWAIALVQLLAGVPSEQVTADYLGSNDALRHSHGPLLTQFEESGGDAASLARILYVEPDYLDVGLSSLRRAFGDLEGYLVAGLGLDRLEVDVLRERLTG